MQRIFLLCRPIIVLFDNTHKHYYFTYAYGRGFYYILSYILFLLTITCELNDSNIFILTGKRSVVNKEIYNI